MKKSILTSLLASSLLFSCSEGGQGGGSSKTKSQTTDTLELEMSGIYRAKLVPINPQFSQHLNGSVTVVKENDELVIDVRFSGGPKSVLHTQSIHIGERCPTEKDDLNGDGIIDAEEGARVYQGILIPLDDDLSSLRMGLGIFPVSDIYGYYFWSRSVSFEKLMNDLHEEDINLTDDYVKLSPNKNFHASGKVVVIRGIPQSEVLPETVPGRGRQGPHEALPVACGVISKLTHTPGEIDNDETDIPVPGGQTLGGTSGYDDGAIFLPRETGGGIGNYGDDDEEPETRNNSTEFGNTTGGVVP